jgi:hypothetical protein
LGAALRVTKGYLKGRVIVIPDDRPFVLGSSLEADLTMFGTGVAEKHAIFEPTEDDRHVLKPTDDNIVIVDGDELDDEGTELLDGAEIQIGKHKITYEPLLGANDISTSSELLPDASEEGAPIPADTRCLSCGDTLGPDADAFEPGAEKASLRAVRLSDGIVCPRCVDKRLTTTRDLGEFKVVRKTASNELEVTYLAVDTRNGRRVGLRILKAERCGDEAIVRRFLCRALVGLALGHPNFVEVVSVSATRGITFVVMEHVERAQKLERIIRDKTPLSTERSLLIVNQLAEVLRFGRERGVVVAKRKRMGVLVGKTGWVKVLSFDLTKEVEERVARSPAYQELVKGGGKGPYSAPRPEPESLLRLAPERAEVLGLARIYFQLLTGRDYEARVAQKCVEQALRRSPDEPLAEAPSRLKKDRLKVPPSLEHVPRSAVLILERLHAAPTDENALATLEGVCAATKQAYLELAAAAKAT